MESIYLVYYSLIMLNIQFFYNHLEFHRQAKQPDLYTKSQNQISFFLAAKEL